MSDQQPPPQNEDTAVVAGPDEASGTAQDQQVQGDPYEKRYNDLRPEFDRATAERNQLAERQQWYEVLLTTDDEDTRRQALEILGYELPEQEELAEPDEYEDPYESLAQRQEELEQRIAQQDEQARQAVEGDFITDYAHSQLDQLGIPRADEETRRMIFERALGLPNLRPSPGMPVGWLPDMKAAHEQFQAWEDNRMKAWAKTKRAPYVPSGGRDATEAPDPGTGHQARLNRAMLFLHNNAGDNE